MKTYDVLIVGGGAGGVASALAAARQGLSVLLVEAQPRLGGNAVNALVCGWEPGMGGTGIPFDLYRRLRRRHGQVAIAGLGRHFRSPEPEWSDYPGGEYVLREDRTYADTLRSAAGLDAGMQHWAQLRRSIFHVALRPESYAECCAEAVLEAGVEVVLDARVVAANATSGVISEVLLHDGRRLSASYFIDASADLVLAAAVGCQLRQGRESRSQYSEPSAPESDEPTAINGVTQLYRITPCWEGECGVEDLPEGIPARCWWRDDMPDSCVVNMVPDGDRVVNMLPTLLGSEFLALGSAAVVEARRRAWCHWHFLQTRWPEFRRFRMRQLAPVLGVREGPRVVALRTLTQHDVCGGLATQTDDDIIAIADHGLDMHGGPAGGYQRAKPYGVPLRSLLPSNTSNLLVACRGAGFSSLAASSCRLTRTMMQLGQAAGTAVALSLRKCCSPSALPGPEIRQQLSDQGVQLTWPMEPEIARRVSDDARVTAADL